MQPTTRRLALQLAASTAAASILLPAQPATTTLKRVYVDKMFGLEAYVEKALKDRELPFDFVEEAKQPDLKATARKKNSNFYAEILYREKFGRNEDHTLELYNLEKKKVLAFYDFKLVADAAGLQRIAQEFATRVASALKSGK